MEIDLRIRTVDSEPADVVAAAIAAERAGFSAVWLADQLSGETSGGRWNLECWTLLSAVAARTTRVMVGPFVLNIANRDPATMAIAAATLQRLSGGRLLFGLGAGAGATNLYSRDQLDLGRIPAADHERRAALVAAIRQTRQLWTEGTDTFLKPDPHPPIIIGTFGPKVARIAAEEADGIAVPLDGYMGGPPMEELIAMARDRRQEVGGKALITIVHSPPRSEFDEDRWLPGSSVSKRLLEAGVDRFVLQALPDPQRISHVDSRLVMAHA
jgi:alkanesulfonate monooxygenase SsuD/methylene tetrahydromethanopterin reductase-like flavin-dependent oxidoreductase (luciferase family)